MSENKKWFVYILTCADGTLYTGVTNDVARRLQMHSAGKGAKYTKGRGPLCLSYCEKCNSRSDALKREAEIKWMPRSEKLVLIDHANTLQTV